MIEENLEKAITIQRMKKLPWFEILLTAAVMSIGLYAALTDSQNFSWRWFTRDDAYYYFKVAQNISEGNGSTFDGINPTNGYHPLWMLICVPIFALARFDLILPLRVLVLVMSGLSAATGILLYRLIGRLFAPAIGAVAALYWVFNYDLLTRVYQQGLETGIATFFILLLAVRLFDFERAWRNGKATNKHLITLGVIATLAMFSRLDLVFLAGIVGIWIVFRGHPLRFLVPLDIVLTAACVLLAFTARLPFREYYNYSDVAVVMIAVSLVINLLSAYLLGLYQRAVIFDPRKLLWRLTVFSVGAPLLEPRTFQRFSKNGHRPGCAFHLPSFWDRPTRFPRTKNGSLRPASRPRPDQPLPPALEELAEGWNRLLRHRARCAGKLHALE
jgi:hypothetical protein